MEDNQESRGLGSADFEGAPPDRQLSLDELGQLPVDEREAYWLAHYYKGDDVPQLTVRAVLIGAFLGGVMSLSNLYIGLKTGWALGIAITACILSYAINKVLRLHMSVLENNCMQSTASSAGYSTGGTMVSAVAAYLMLTGQHMAWPILTAWTFFLAMLGVFLAIPMKRQMIDVDQLRFPSGVAAAETLKSLHSEGAEAQAKASSLATAGAASALWKIALEFMERRGISTQLAPSLNYFGFPLKSWTISFDLSLVLLAAGAIVGWKMCWSMLLGSFLNYAVLAPKLVSIGAIQTHDGQLGFRDIVSWSTWAGASMMVTSSLFAFALQWRTVARALSGFTALFGTKEVRTSSAVEAIQVPNSWFAIGSLVAGAGCVAVLHYAFDTRVWVSIIAVLLSFVLCLVACRATGESDITPMGAMGKVAQLTFGGLVPSNMVTNLMTASVTAGAASASADLLTDLKSGYILGANPRRQFIAQFLGVFAGTIVVVPAFYVLVPNAASLGGEQWPAPAAMVWKKVAELLAQGVSALHPTAQIGLVCGAVVGVLLPVIEMLTPKQLRYLIPSATGIGLAFVIPFSNALSFFIGAVVARVWQRFAPANCEKYMVPVASGIIAGESLTGVGVALSNAAPGLVKALSQH